MPINGTKCFQAVSLYVYPNLVVRVIFTDPRYKSHFGGLFWGRSFFRVLSRVSKRGSSEPERRRFLWHPLQLMVSTHVYPNLVVRLIFTNPNLVVRLILSRVSERSSCSPKRRCFLSHPLWLMIVSIHSSKIYVYVLCE